MTPMIDMVFQLIAFFMVLVNFSEIEQDQRVELPLSELAKPPEEAYVRPLTLQMTGTEEVLINASRDLLSVDEARLQLQREAQIVRAAGEQDLIQKVTVVVRADKGARTGKVQEMIKAAQDAGFENFALRGKQDQVSLRSEE